MPHDHPAGHRDEPVQYRVASLKDRVDALEKQSQQSQRGQHAAEERESKLRRFNAVLTRLSLSRTLAEGNVEDAYREIVESSAEALDVDRVGIWLFNSNQTRLCAVDVYDRRTRGHSCKEVLSAEQYQRYFAALREGRTVPADDARNDSRTSELRDDYLIPCGITSMLDAPVRVDGQVVGVICHEHLGPLRQWTIDDQTFAGSMGDLVSLTLQAKRRRDAESETERQRRYLRQIIDIAPNVVFVLDQHGSFVFVNQALADLVKLQPSEVVGRLGVDFVSDKDLAARLQQMDRDILEGRQKHVVAVEEIVDLEGNPHWFQITKRPVIGMNGKDTQVLGVAVDITERKLYEQRLAMLVRELDHRVKNNLFAVMIMAEQTAASVESIEEFLPAYTGRIRAMAIAHEMLASANWQGARLSEMVQRLVQPYTIAKPQRVTIKGPDVLLPPPIAPPLCMMLHELATNAATHGALSAPDGTVHVQWDIRDAVLELTWTEAGGPTASAPEKSGFGLELIERTAQHQLRGEGTIEFAEQGLRCRLSIPLEPPSKQESTAPPPEN